MMHLVKCYLPVVRLVSRFSEPEMSLLDDEAFRQLVLPLFEQAMNDSRAAGVSQEEVDDARFAMAVWFDEMVLRSALPVRQQWRNSMLQTQWYNTVIGGEIFFERMDSVPDDQKALRMVFLNCLLMGFHGKYHQHDCSELSARIDSERLHLPDGWSEWPNTQEITPMYYAAKKKKGVGLVRIFNEKYIVVFALLLSYAICGLIISLD